MQPSILVNCLVSCVFILVVSFEHISPLDTYLTSWHFDPVYHIAWEVVKIRHFDYLNVIASQRTSHTAYKWITLEFETTSARAFSLSVRFN